jgi:hypothetical protein
MEDTAANRVAAAVAAHARDNQHCIDVETTVTTDRGARQ